MMASKELVKDFGLPNPLDNNAASRIVPDMTLNKVTLTLIRSESKKKVPNLNSHKYFIFQPISI